MILPSFGYAARAASVAALAVATAAPAAVAASFCASPVERAALDTRVLQTELVVAALTCGEKARYGQFVQKFSNELVLRGSGLKAYFARTYGGQGTQRMNAKVTELANEASQRSMAYQGDFCGDAAKLFDAVLRVDPKDLVAFSATLPAAGSHGVSECGNAQVAEKDTRN